MSSNNQVLNTGQQSTTNYDTSKIFVWNNRYEKANYTNSTYSPVTLSAGTLMGRVGTSQEIVPLKSSASNGSQFPVGILAHDALVDDGDTVELTICKGGDVVESKVVLDSGDTMATLISSRSIRDRIAGDIGDIKLVVSTELTGNDNQ